MAGGGGRGPGSARVRGQSAQNGLERIGRQPFELFRAPVLDRVGHPHDLGFEAERRDLEGGRLPEGRCGDEEAGKPEVVQRLDVVQTARYA